MRKHWRALPALLVAATLLAPVTPASAGWSCSYYRYDTGTRSWVQVASLQPKDEYRSTHQEGVDFHCEYCYVPTITRRDPENPLGVLGTDPQLIAQDIVATVAEAQVPEPGAVPVDPWSYPPCPLVPPVWDADPLKPVNDVIGLH